MERHKIDIKARKKFAALRQETAMDVIHEATYVGAANYSGMKAANLRWFTLVS
jgi:hypothetical protein